MSTVPCELCSMPTPMTGTKRCDRCWELEHRIHGDPELARKILSLVQPEELRTREDEARECLAIARSYAGSWLSPTADEIVTALERRVNAHAVTVLQSPPQLREGNKS